MNLTFITECRFYKTANGTYYAGDMSYNSLLWERYLKEFDEIYVVARVFESAENFEESFLVNNVHFLPLPPYDTINSYAKNFIEIKNALKKFINKDSVTIIRGGGVLGYWAGLICKRRNIYFGIEVIGDPYDVFAPGVIQHPLRSILRLLFTYFQKKVVKDAIAVIYVTKNALQKRYPASKTAFVNFASDVFLNADKPVLESKKLQTDKVINLISIGSLDQMYKSPDVLIRAVKRLVSKGINVKLTWLGKGKFRQHMEQLAHGLEIEDKVVFMGSVSSEEVTRYLDASDIFLLVSRTEGLPRAVVEAMSRGLPCIGTNIGGIPELLQKEVLVEPESFEEVSNMIEYFISNKDIADYQAKINLEASKEYSFETLDSKRNDFYKFLKTNHNC